MRIGLDLLSEPPVVAGTGIYVLNLLRALAAEGSGHEFVVLASHDNLERFYMEQPNFRFQAYKFGSGRAVVRRLSQQLLLCGRCRGLGLDVLHSVNNVLPLLYRGRTVVTVHDLASLAVPKRFRLAKRLYLQHFTRLSVAKADRVIAVSSHTRRDIMAYFRPPANKVALVPQGVAERFQPQPNAQRGALGRLGISREYILFVGRMEAGKNLLRLVKAYASLGAELRARFQLVIAGPEGDATPGLREQVRGLGLEGDVVFPGYVPEEDLPALYCLARLLVLPSVYEGFGLPLLEAMACGTPVVASRVSSMPEVVGEAGLLVDPQSHEDIARALERLCRDDGLHARLGRLGLAQAAKFGWRQVARQTLRVYEEAAAP
jgi:glycosyltransferase involved in cell wall biosynthesis